MWRPSRWGLTSGAPVRAPVRRMPPRHVAASAMSPSAQTPGVSAWVSAGQITAFFTTRSSLDHPPSGRGSEIIRYVPCYAGKLRNGPENGPPCCSSGRLCRNLRVVAAGCCPAPAALRGLACPGSARFRRGAVLRFRAGQNPLCQRVAGDQHDQLAAGAGGGLLGACAFAQRDQVAQLHAGRPPRGNRLIDCS